MRELVLAEENNKLEAYLLEDRHLVEYYSVSKDNSHVLGDIFLGIVTRVLEGLNSVFVDIGLSKEGFLHYSDIGPAFSWKKAFIELIRYKKPLGAWEELLEESKRSGNIKDLLKVGDWVLVRLEKEMVASKGPRLSMHLSLAGRYLVLTPLSPEKGISMRITDQSERQRLREIVHQLYRPPYGLILRTSAEKASLEEIRGEYQSLIATWEALVERLPLLTPPARLSEPSSPLQSLLREITGPWPEVIHVESPDFYEQLQALLGEASKSEMACHVKLHRRRERLIEYFGLDKVLPLLLGRTVTLPNGGYIVIEHTEALHAIDVNSGSAPTEGKTPEEAILQTNLLAAREVARQIRLRDLGGIIVIDFIDMRRPEYRQKVWEVLREAMKADRAKHHILPMSEFGLVQITRQRRRNPLHLTISNPCPLCQGTGQFASTTQVIHRLEEMLRWHAQRWRRIPLRIRAHPLLGRYWQAIYPCRGPWLWNLIPHQWALLELDPQQLPFTLQLHTFTGKLIADLT